MIALAGLVVIAFVLWRAGRSRAAIVALGAVFGVVLFAATFTVLSRR